ncbi:hypothetical protein [Ferruginibacter sp. HRS2-29]|uniref:hypothetical protein n=1 Tax=Ferruginibacter sp. HRS2-29 TaxID=2487334 RepID=UPI0020CE6F9A|nr:hypothetical protein [Ferruginibacter sp. HRS2-29]
MKKGLLGNALLMSMISALIFMNCYVRVYSFKSEKKSVAKILDEEIEHIGNKLL